MTTAEDMRGAILRADPRLRIAGAGQRAGKARFDRGHAV